MGTFNERAEKLMEKLFYYFANNKKEAKMHRLVNCVTLDVIAKVLCHTSHASLLPSKESLIKLFFKIVLFLPRDL